MGLLRDLYPWDDNTYGNNVKTLRVLIECKQGSAHKYEWDDKINAPVIVRDLASKFKYPYSYGTVPQTLAGDGDSLDAIVVTDEPVEPGTILNCKVLGIIRMIDNGEQDDKLLCVPFYVKHGTVNLKKIVRYLKNYKYPNQAGTELLGMEDEAAAIKAVNDAHTAFMQGGFKK